MSKWGAIPTDKELTTTLIRLAQNHYEGRWAVPITVYDQDRPRGWAKGKRILRHHGLPQNPAGWTVLTARLTGLTVASMEETRRHNAQLRWERERSRRVQALDEPVERLRSSEWRQAVEATDGMIFIPRWRKIKRWDPQSKAYEIIGEQLVYEVR